MTMKTCPTCGDNFDKLGMHWQYNENHIESLSDKQLEILTGLLMSDGTLYRQCKNPYFQCDMVTKKYLNWLDEEKFPLFGSGVRLVSTAKENAKRARDSEFSPDAKAENYSDVYRWSTMSLEELQVLADWYTTGEKVWPCDEINLTPKILKHLYIGDGHYSVNSDSQRISIATSHIEGRKESIANMFSRVGFPVENFYQQQITQDCKKTAMTFTESMSVEMFEYMGSPPPGFKYKWPDGTQW